MIKILVVIASVALAAVAGCGSPPQSASAACKDFTTWYGEQGGKIQARNMALLRRAVSEAPGRLYRDMHLLELDISSHRSFMKTNSAPRDAVLRNDGDQVVADCRSANPG